MNFIGCWINKTTSSASAVFSFWVLGLLCCQAQSVTTYLGGATAWFSSPSTNWSGGPAGTYAGVSGAAGAGNANDIALFSTNGGSLGINLNPSNGSTFNLGAITVTGSTALTLGQSSTTTGLGTRNLVLNGAFAGNGAGLIAKTLLNATGANITINETNGGASTSPLGLRLGITDGLINAGSGRTIALNIVVSEATANSGFTKTGTGTLTLSGLNTYTGTTTIGEGILSASQIVVSSGSSNLGNTTSAVELGAASTTGTLSYTGSTATFTRGFTVNAGGGQISNASVSGLLTIATGGISSSGTLTLAANTGGITINSAISGAGGISITSGAVALSTTNSYTDSTAISGNSTLTATTASLNGSDTANGITFNSGTLKTDTGGIATSKAISMTGDGSFDTNGNNSELSGNFTGSGGFTKSGAGVLTLSGPNTSYSGAITISTDGTLKLGSDTALGSTSAGTTISSGGTLDLNGKTVGAEAVGLSGTGVSFGGGLINSDTGNGASLSGVVTLTGTTSLGGSGAFVLSSGIVGASATNALVKVGAGTVTLSASAGTNRSSGTASTQIDGGVLRISNGTALNTGSTGGIAINGGILELTGSITLNQPITFNSGATLRSDGTNDSNGKMTVSNTANASVTVATVNSGDVFTVGNGSADISGGSSTSAIHLAGPGTILLSQSSDYVGNWSLDSGTALLQSVAAGSQFGVTNTASLTLNGGNIRVNYTNSAGAISFTGGAGNNVFVSSNSTITSDRTTSGNGFVHTFGALSIGSSTLTIAGGANVTGGTAGIILGSTTLTGNAAFNITNPSGGGNTLLTLGATGETGGARSFTKQGAGTLVLSGNNTYTGTTTISEGALTLSGNGSLADTSAVNLTSNTSSFSIAAINALSEGVASLSGVAGSQVHLGDKTLITVGDADTTFSGVADGTGAITKQGTGQLTLNGANTYTGTTTVSGGGTLLLGADSTLNVGSKMTLSGGTLAAGGKTNSLGEFSQTTGVNIIDFAAGDGSLTFNSTGTWSGTLSIWNYTGAIWASGTDKLFFASSSLSNEQLSMIKFYTGSGTGAIGSGASFLGTELVPVPEPGAMLTGLLLLGLVGFRERRPCLRCRAAGQG